jgi:MFS family permease
VTIPIAAEQSERKTLIWMCLLIGVNQLGFGAVIPVLPLYADSFGVSQAAIGATVAVYGLARLLTGIPAGRIADWFGRRNALALGGIVSALGNIWCAYATSFSELTVARFVAGAGAGLTLTAGMIVLADITTAARRGRVMAIYQGVFLFAVGIGPFPGGYMADHFGLDVPFLAYGGASAIAAVVGWFGVAETRHLARDARAVNEPTLSYLTQLKTILKPIGFKLVSSISFINAVVRTGGLFAIIPIVGTQRLGLSATEIGFAMAFGSIAGVLLAYPGGILVDRFGRKAVIVPSTIATGLAFLTFGLASSFTWFLLATGIWGIASSISGAAPAAYAADISPKAYSATAMSAYRTLSDAGYVVGPIVLGAIADGFGLSVPLYVASILLISIGLSFARFAPESYAARDVR